MPLSDDLSHRNFITKIVKYDRVVNVPNSMTVLTEMLPVSLIMAERKLTGTVGCYSRQEHSCTKFSSLICLLFCYCC